MKQDLRTPTELLAAGQAGNRQAIGRLLTMVEHDVETSDAVTAVTHAGAGNAHIIGVTGPPGSGKSTLVGQLLRVMVGRNLHPAVVAVDPSSPVSGGAILGDRIRIDATDTGAFIRSIATRGQAGGLALAVPGAVRVLDAAGFDPILIETVGVGQVEIDIAGTADTTIVVSNPGTGDAVQANKAGLLEVADIFVVNKSDLPGADQVRRDLELMLELSHMTGQEDPTGRRPPIIMANSLDGSGADLLLAEITAHHQHLTATGQLSGRRVLRERAEVRTRAAHRLLAALEDRISSDDGAKILAALADRALTPAEATDRLARPFLPDQP